MFRDRADAGRQLAPLLDRYRDAQHYVVLALPRGGVPVAAEVARALNLPLDVLVVRKLGLPGHEEYAAGAIAVGGVHVTGEDAPGMARVLKRERRELQRREREYREHCAPLDLHGMTAILIDDGLATGLSMRAAVIAARALGAASVIVAVPVGSATACRALGGMDVSSPATAHADEVVCMQVPEPFVAVGAWYRSFEAPGDEEVRRTLAQWR
ncbi:MULTISPECIES: phosphoribosyltransferase family protein [unclassified Variovorax]|jgi:predicted phosphoribosyltransferase|uniref:phosphoribosyltransferase n=1 Tax=unclassified Variovorax TaxID=663243 RepID=UPI000F7F01B9|nr:MULTISPECIES: phosphoribosyltransferase family protein [unclassified Variovorax]RSZ47369.1 phosphoribosyltransferase [Variovorax sp. 553]RSZ48506.1 phosphoribosyltransferase [Variovorax sp. 679]